MRKCMKIISIIIITMIIFLLCSEVYAATCNRCYGSGVIQYANIKCTACGGTGKLLEEKNVGDIVTGGDEFISIGENISSPIGTGNLKKLSDTIYNILLTIGIIIAFIIAGIIGIKYMIGGIEGQAEVKNALVPYVIGCAVVFGAFTIWKIVLLILQ